MGRTSWIMKRVFTNMKLLVLLFVVHQITEIECQDITFLSSQEQILSIKDKLKSALQLIQNYLSSVDDSFKTAKLKVKNGTELLTDMTIYLLQAIKLFKGGSTTQGIDQRFGGSNADNFQLSNLEEDIIKFILHLTLSCKKEIGNSDENLIDECVNATRSYDFDKAVEILEKIDNDEVIDDVVNQVYRKEILSYFNLLEQFINAVYNPKKKYLIIKALYSEMKIHREIKWGKTLNLGKIIKEMLKFYDEDLQSNQSLKQGILDLESIIKEDLRQSGVNYLEDLILFKNWGGISEGNTILNELFYYDPELFEKIHTDYFISVVFYGWGQIMSNLMSLTASRGDVAQELSLIKAYLKASKYYNDKNLVEVLMQFKINAETLNIWSSSYRDVFKNNLPQSLYSLMFATKFCIKNVGLNQYLKTGGSNETYYLQDKERRNVYTDSAALHNNIGLWKLKYLVKDIFNIYSQENSKEYMYAAISAYVENRRIIWVWIPGNLDETGRWTLEPTGNFVYMKNINNEYLYASNKMTDTFKGWQAGHVYSLTGGSKDCPDKSCVWLIEDCSNL